MLNNKLQSILDLHTNTYDEAPQICDISSFTLTVSFVIPIYNSAASLAPCLESILAQKRNDLILEIITVDDGSTDNSLELLRDFSMTHPDSKITIIANRERHYSAYARNRGLEVASGDIICFIDSDIILPPDYIVEHISQHQSQRSCITFSLRSNIADADEAQFPITKIIGDFRYGPLSQSEKLQNVSFSFSDTCSLAELCLTCAVSYRRADLLKVKGCPENFVGWGFNDTAMAAKVIALGNTVVPILHCPVYHIEHKARSGNSSKKWSEFAINKKRYLKMLELAPRQTYAYQIDVIEI